jgi:hypothetical protein
MDPAFPDIVGEHAVSQIAEAHTAFSYCANDNGGDLDPEIADPLFEMMAQREIAATRLW